MLLALVLKALAIMFGLPALGLIQFTAATTAGGFIAAFLTAFIAGIFGAVAKAVLAVLAPLELAIAALLGAEAGGAGGAAVAGIISLVVGFLLYCVALYLSLAVAAAFIPGVVLLGFWKTVFSSLILSAVTTVAHKIQR